MKKRALLNFAASALYQVISLLVGMILPKFYTETFGSVYNGLNQSVSQIMSLLAVLQFGISAAAIQLMFRPIAQNDEKGIAAIYWDTGKQYRKMGYIFIGVIVPVIAVFPLLIKEDLSYQIVAFFLLARTISSAMEYFFQAKYSVIMVAHNMSFMIYSFNIILLFVSTALHLLVLFTTKNIVFYQLVLVATALLRFAIVGTYVRKKFPYLQNYRKQDLPVERASQRTDVLVSEIAGMVINSTDLLVLSTFSSLVNASIYSVYHFVVMGLWSVLSSCREAVFAGIGKLYFESIEAFKKKMDSFESVYLALAFYLYSLCVILFRPFIEVYTANMDAQYYYAGLPILFVLCKLIVSMRIPSIVAVNTAGHFKQVKYFAVIEAVINLVVSLALVKPLGIYGVLVGTLAGAAYRTPVLVHYVNKNILERKHWAYWKKVLPWGVFLALCWLASEFWVLPCTSLVGWVLLAAVCAAALLVVAAIWMFVFNRSALVAMAGMVRRKMGRR